MNNQTKVIIGLVVAMLLSFFLGMSINNKKVMQEPPIQQEQQIKDEFTGLSVEQQTQMAVEYLDSISEEIFGVGGYDIVSEEGEVILYSDISTYEIVSCSESDYSSLIDTLVETSAGVTTDIHALGCTDVTVIIGVADISEDMVFLLAQDGVLLFDIYNQ